MFHLTFQCEEVAFFETRYSKADQFEGESTIYVDDFEGSQSTIDMRSPYAWSLASTPDRNALSTYDFNANSNDLSYGFKKPN
jgi:cell surface protein SprA